MKSRTKDALRKQFLGEITERLRILRQASGRTRAEVSKGLGVTEGQYGHWELGNVIVPSYYLNSIADYYGVTVDYLLGKIEPRILEPLEKLIRELQEHRDFIEAGQTKTGFMTGFMILGGLVRVGQIFLGSTASSVYLVDDPPSALSKVSESGYSRGLVTPEKYSLKKELNSGEGSAPPERNKALTASKKGKWMRTTVKVFLEGTSEVKRNPEDIALDEYRGSEDESCGSYFIAPLWAPDDPRPIGVVKFENHVEDNPSDPFGKQDIDAIGGYLSVVAGFLRRGGLLKSMDVSTIDEKLREIVRRFLQELPATSDGCIARIVGRDPKAVSQIRRELLDNTQNMGIG